MTIVLVLPISALETELGEKPPENYTYTHTALLCTQQLGTAILTYAIPLQIYFILYIYIL